MSNFLSSTVLWRPKKSQQLVMSPISTKKILRERHVRIVYRYGHILSVHVRFIQQTSLVISLGARRAERHFLGWCWIVSFSVGVTFFRALHPQHDEVHLRLQACSPPGVLRWKPRSFLPRPRSSLQGTRGTVDDLQMVPQLERDPAVAGEESRIGQTDLTHTRTSGTLHCETHSALQQKSRGSGVS